MTDPRDPLADKWAHMDALDKVGWMIEIDGYAIEPVPADPATSPPRAGYTYTIGLTTNAGFPEVVVFGLTPVAAKGLIGLVVDAVRGGTEIPLDVDLVGLLDNELRCRFVNVDLGEWGPMFTTAQAWYNGEPFSVVQLVYPDRNGFMPDEAGFDRRMRFAQPLL